MVFKPAEAFFVVLEAVIFGGIIATAIECLPGLISNSDEPLRGLGITMFLALIVVGGWNLYDDLRRGRRIYVALTTSDVGR